MGDLEDLHPAWRREPTPIPVRMVAGALRRSLDPASQGDHDLLPLQNAFEKVGVRNRGELVKRLFFENLLPGMLGG